MNPQYIIGLTDGEGSFTVFIRNPDSKDKVKRRVYFEPRFYIKLIEKDKDILYKLKNFFKCGSVYFQKDTRPNHQNCYRYEVFNREELQTIIIPFFKKHPLMFVSKAKDFKIFCQLMEKMKQGKHLTEKGLRELYKLKQLMH